MLDTQTVSHYDTLNLVLANACPYSENEDGTVTFKLTAHCKQYTIIATHHGNLEYMIRSIEAKDY